MVDDRIKALAESLSRCEHVRAIALSGGDRPLPEPGEGDIDLFVYCSEIPTSERRRAFYTALTDLSSLSMDRLGGGRWGVADSMSVGGVETWVMYFTQAEAGEEISAIVAGEQMGKQDNYFYPSGRLAMLRGFRVLYDCEGYLGKLQKHLEVFPDALSKALIAFHLDALSDREDLLRAVSRRDVLFYHFALDLALDHVLQLLFALNRVFFPSRKRSLGHIERFAVKPEGIDKMLLNTVRLGANGETLAESYEILSSIIDWLREEGRRAAQ